MASNYKTIKGIKYDKGLLEIADASVAGKKDGKISIKDAKKIIEKASEGQGISDVESRTLQYIHDNYNFTPSSGEYFAGFLTGSPEEESPEESVIPHDVDEAVTEIKGFLTRYHLLMVVVILVLVLLYLNFDRVSDFFSKDTRPVSAVVSDKSADDVYKAADIPAEVAVSEKSEVVTAGENEYIVREKDTLFDISGRIYGDPGKWEALYNRNRDVIDDPSMIFPGQKIRTDIE